VIHGAGQKEHGLILVSLRLISQVFFYLSKRLFSGLLPFKGNFVSGLDNTKYRDSSLSKGFLFEILSFDACIEKQKIPNLFLV